MWLCVRRPAGEKERYKRLPVLGNQLSALSSDSLPQPPSIHNSTERSRGATWRQQPKANGERAVGRSRAVITQQARSLALADNTHDAHARKSRNVCARTITLTTGNTPNPKPYSPFPPHARPSH